MSSEPRNTFAAFDPQAHALGMQEKNASEERREAIKKIHELQQRLSLGGLKIRDLINEGRR